MSVESLEISQAILTTIVCRVCFLRSQWNRKELEEEGNLKEIGKGTKRNEKTAEDPRGYSVRPGSESSAVSSLITPAS